MKMYIFYQCHHNGVLYKYNYIYTYYLYWYTIIIYVREYCRSNAVVNELIYLIVC